MKIFQQVAEGRIFLLNITKIYLRIKINGSKNIAQLSAVVFFNVRQGYVNLLTDFIVITLTVKEIKGRFFINRKPFPAHGSLHTAFITVILNHVVFSFFLSDITQVFHKKHRQDVVFITGAVDLSSEAVTGLPEDSFNIRTRCHFSYLSSCQ